MSVIVVGIVLLVWILVFMSCVVFIFWGNGMLCVMMVDLSVISGWFCLIVLRIFLEKIIRLFMEFGRGEWVMYGFFY